MFGTIRKHQSWLWVVIVTVTIISFVQFFNPASRSGGQRDSVDLGTIDGERISREDFMNAAAEASLHFFLSYGSWPDADAKRVGYDADRETYSRLFFIAKLKQNNIHVDSDSVARAANAILANMGRGNAVPLEAFEEQILKPHGMNANDFQRYIRHDLGIQQLVTTIGVAGKLVTPEEAKDLYMRERQEISASAVFFNASNYLANVVTILPEALAQFYTNNQSKYTIPDRVQVSYVQFDITNFNSEADEQIAKMTNFSAIVDQAYLQRGTNYYKDMTATEAKAKIRTDFHTELATVAAKKKANDFASELFDQQPQHAENLNKLAASKNLTVKVSAPFDEQNGPEFDGGVNFARTAFRLTDEEPFAGPLAGKDAVYVIALNKKIPHEVPPLAEIRSRVEADFKYTQAARMARAAGAQFGNTLTNGLAQGKTFAGICSEAKVKPTMIPPFALGTRELPEVEEMISLDQFKQIVFGIPDGKSSGFVPTPEGGLVVFVQTHLPVDEAKMRAEMPEFLKNIRQARQNEAINFWYRREAEKSMRDTLIQRQQPTMAPGQSRS